MNKVKYFIVFLVPILMFIQAFSSASEITWENIDKLNEDLTSYKKYIPKEDLEKLFKETIYINKKLVDEFEKLRTEAYKKNDFKKIEKYIKRSMPAILVVVGGDANYINPNAGFFLKSSDPKSIEYKFFELTQSGWYDQDGNIYGGKNIVPDWIKLETGITGKVKQDVKNKMLKKWKNLKPKLSGIYLKIADSTINYLNK